MTGIYFSGTGNTKFCAEEFLRCYDRSGRAVSIEDNQAEMLLLEEKEILLAYPVYGSDLPRIMKEFLEKQKEHFAGKRVFILATMAMFSGDGAGCAARFLKKQGAVILGGLHVIMPDCISDELVLTKTDEENSRIVKAARQKLKLAAQALQEGRPPADGLGFGARMAGFLVQRMWFGLLAGRCTGKLKINADTCVGCGKCAAGCPMENLRMEEGKAEAGKNCTLCYRCVNRCPAQAITLLGKRVVKQNDIAKYVTGDAEDSGKASFPFAGKE